MSSAASGEAALDFYPYGCSGLPVAGKTTHPNRSNMSIATVGARGEFISSRPMTSDELAQAWAEHNARHAGGGK